MLFCYVFVFDDIINYMNNLSYIDIMCLVVVEFVLDGDEWGEFVVWIYVFVKFILLFFWFIMYNFICFIEICMNESFSISYIY